MNKFSQIVKKYKELVSKLRELIHRLIHRNAVPDIQKIATPESQAKQHKLNPYVEARREWNERYGDYISQAHNWRLVALICAVTSLVCVMGISYIGAQNKIVPYVVEVDKLGQTRAVRAANKAAPVDPRVIKASLSQFVQNWRMVTSDQEVQQDSIKRLYALLPKGAAALQKLNDYFRANDPFKRSATTKVAIEVNSIMPISQKTWQIDWDEKIYKANGEAQGSTHWRGFLIVAFNPPTDEMQILNNPLGVYVTDLNWAQQF